MIKRWWIESYFSFHDPGTYVWCFYILRLLAAMATIQQNFSNGPSQYRAQPSFLSLYNTIISTISIHLQMPTSPSKQNYGQLVLIVSFVFQSLIDNMLYASTLTWLTYPHHHRHRLISPLTRFPYKHGRPMFLYISTFHPPHLHLHHLNSTNYTILLHRRWSLFRGVRSSLRLWKLQKHLVPLLGRWSAGLLRAKG